MFLGLINKDEEFRSSWNTSVRESLVELGFGHVFGDSNLDDTWIALDLDEQYGLRHRIPPLGLVRVFTRDVAFSGSGISRPDA
jgi:hypothetical protein